MRPMDHAEVEELLAAYALWTLPAEETRRLEAHLGECAEHRQAAAELQATASRMALAVEDQEPPAALRQRIADAVRETSQAPSSGPASASAPAPIVRPPTTRWRRRVAPTQLAAAAGIALALAVGIVAGTRLAQPAQQTWTFSGGQRAPGAEATVLYDRSTQTAVVAVTGLPVLEPGQVYEVWLIRDGVPIEAGISAEPTGKALVRVKEDVTKFQQVAVTIERGEQQKPTTDPILVGTLS